MTTVAKRVNTLLDGPTVLNSNTRSFLQSILSFYEHNNKLTDRQEESLKRIESRHSPESIKAHEEWVANYSDEHRNVAKICAEYYHNQGHYFFDISHRVLNEADFIPTEKQYRAMCENKYATKIVASTLADPKYPVGTFVQHRASCPHHVRVALYGGKAGMILATDTGPVESAAKGAKRYKILPIGSSTPIEAEERHIKKARI